MCFGYRRNGVWEWQNAPQRATWDAASSRYHMRFTIQQGPIDAIKVLFNNGNPRLLGQMVLTTKPTPSDP
jgi:uncharacterized protein with FMN-binding domain